MTAVSAHSNTPQRGVYNYARRPILRTGLRPVQLFLFLRIFAFELRARTVQTDRRAGKKRNAAYGRQHNSDQYTKAGAVTATGSNGLRPVLD